MRTRSLKYTLTPCMHITDAISKRRQSTDKSRQHTQTHTHTHTHTHIHTHTHTRTHAPDCGGRCAPTEFGPVTPCHEGAVNRGREAAGQLRVTLSVDGPGHQHTHAHMQTQRERKRERETHTHTHTPDCGGSCAPAEVGPVTPCHEGAVNRSRKAAGQLGVALSVDGPRRRHSRWGWGGRSRGSDPKWPLCGLRHSPLYRSCEVLCVGGGWCES